jgi:HSP20 family protein
MVRIHPDFLSLFDTDHEAASLVGAVDAMLRGVLSPLALPSHGPLVNVRASEQGMHVTALVPGYSAEQIDVSIEQDRLVLRGQRNEKATEDAEPRVVARFERDFRLPFRVAHDRVQASVKNGVLELDLPRVESDLPRRIPVLQN